MAEALCDIAMFPGATDVVRVNSTRWAAHADVLERLADQIASFLREHSDLPMEDLLSELAQRDPHIRVGDQHAHVLYGPRTFFLGADGELNADMRGIVYKPAHGPQPIDGQSGDAGCARKTKRRAPPRACKSVASTPCVH